jgi:hypothetical protein
MKIPITKYQITDNYQYATNLNDVNLVLDLGVHLAGGD